MSPNLSNSHLKVLNQEIAVRISVSWFVCWFAELLFKMAQRQRASWFYRSKFNFTTCVVLFHTDMNDHVSIKLKEVGPAAPDPDGGDPERSSSAALCGYKKPVTGLLLLLDPLLCWRSSATSLTTCGRSNVSVFTACLCVFLTKLSSDWRFLFWWRVCDQTAPTWSLMTLPPGSSFFQLFILWLWIRDLTEFAQKTNVNMDLQRLIHVCN